MLTAFVLVSYTFLQPDNSALTVQLLLQISTQLGTISNGTLPNLPTLPSPSLTAFNPPASAFRINGLWFASLTLSLITASLGMLVKQWLREYMAGEMISPKERCRVRHFRTQGVVRWRVFEIAAFLPMLLQLSLILFFIGMLYFIRLGDATICWAISSIVALYMLFYATTTISPVFSAQSPFKTSLLKPIFSGARAVLERIKRHVARQFFRLSNYDMPPEEHQMRKRNDFDVEMIIAADATFMDPQFFDNIQFCVRDLESTRTVACVRRLMEQRVGSSIPSLTEAEFAFWRLSHTERLTAASILLDTLSRPVLAAFERQRTDIYWESWMDQAIFGMYMTIRAHLDLGSRTVSPPDLMRLLCGYKAEFAQHLLKNLCQTRMITHLYMPMKRVKYLPNSLSSQGE